MIAPDKWGHYKAGALICTVVGAICTCAGMKFQACAITGAFASLMVGIAKEIYDQFHPDKHAPDKWDAAATFMGGLSAVGVIALLRWGALAMTLFLLTCGLAGCGGITVPRMPATGHGPAIGTPGSLLTTIALVCTGLAGVGLVVCGIAAIWYPNKWKVAKLAITCFVVAACGQILYWYGQHLALASGLLAAVVVVGIAGYVFIHRKQIKKDIEWRTGLDIDGDGKVDSKNADTEIYKKKQ